MTENLSGFQRKKHGGVTHNIDVGENQEKNKKVHALTLREKMEKNGEVILSF